MKIIKELSEMIEEELCDVDKYVKAAIREKPDNPSLSEVFYTLAREEMDHSERLHAAVVKVIKNYRDKNGDPPPGMQALYDYLHEAHMEKAARLQYYLNKYTE